jgi:hypothetical protein
VIKIIGRNCIVFVKILHLMFGWFLLTSELPQIPDTKIGRKTLKRKKIKLKRKKIMVNEKKC